MSGRNVNLEFLETLLEMSRDDAFGTCALGFIPRFAPGVVDAQFSTSIVLDLQQQVVENVTDPKIASRVPAAGICSSGAFGPVLVIARNLINSDVTRLARYTPSQSSSDKCQHRRSLPRRFVHASPFNYGTSSCHSSLHQPPAPAPASAEIPINQTRPSRSLNPFNRSRWVRTAAGRTSVSSNVPPNRARFAADGSTAAIARNTTVPSR